MVQAARTGKAAKRDELIAIVEEQVANFDSFNNNTYKSSLYDLETRQGLYEGNFVTVTKAKVDGLTPELLADFRSNIESIMNKMNDRLTLTRLEDCEGCVVRHQKIKMGFMMSNRSTINIYHTVKNDDGSIVSLTTSLGNEDLVEKYKKEIGKDVLATNYFSYTKVVPYEGGCEITMANCMDIGGSIPSAMKATGAANAVKNGEKMVHYMLKQEILK